jgi:hypothetical protein
MLLNIEEDVEYSFRPRFVVQDFNCTSGWCGTRTLVFQQEEGTNSPHTVSLRRNKRSIKYNSD